MAMHIFLDQDLKLKFNNTRNFIRKQFILVCFKAIMKQQKKSLKKVLCKLKSKDWKDTFYKVTGKFEYMKLYISFVKS